jgi:hypothetical protein
VSWLESQAETFLVQVDGAMLYVGDVRSVRTRVKAQDTITEIKGADGSAQYRDATLTRSYAPGVTTSTILRDLTAATGMATDQIGTLEEFVYEGGFVAAGKVADLMEDVVTAAGGEWSIQDGIIQIIAPGAPTTGGLLLTAGSGLIGSPERKDDGISLKVVLQPVLRPGKLFKLESRHITGWYRVEKVTHAATSDGEKWLTTVQAEEAS